MCTMRLVPSVCVNDVSILPRMLTFLSSRNFVDFKSSTSGILGIPVVVSCRCGSKPPWNLLSTKWSEADSLKFFANFYSQA